MRQEPEQLGPWRLGEVLGRGGMGVVYTAVHVHDATRAAVKVAQVRPLSRRALELEIRALSRLSHPGIVRFLGHGAEQGFVWVATEQVDGRPMRERMDSSHASTASGALTTVLLEDLSGTAEGPAVLLERVVWTEADLHAALGVFLRLCSPLAWLHGEGIVHGDVKPDNVLVRNDSSVVLVDFGLYRDLGVTSRDRLTPARRTAGTVAYLSPEQCRGEAPDARSDLYAVGCMLYEWLAGRPPFGRTPHAVRMHAEAPVLPLSDLAQVPAALEALVHALLEKSPRRRLGYATDLAEALGSLGVPADPSPGPTPRHALHRPQLLGRNEALAEALHDRATIVTGAPGVGRTRLLSAVVEGAPSSGVVSVAGAPGCTAALLRGLARCVDPAAASTVFGPDAAVLVAIEPSLTELAGLGPQIQPEPAPATAAARRDAVAVTRAFSAAAPIRIVFDDVHLADERDWAVLGELIRGGAREIRLTLSAPTDDPVVPLLGHAGADPLPLGPLSDDALDQLLSECLAVESLPEELHTFVRGRAGGVPGFASAVVRLLVDERHLRRRRGRWVVVGRDDLRTLPVPDGIADLAARRWRAASPTLRACLEAVAVAGLAAPEADLAEARAAREIDLSGGSLRWAVPALRDLTQDQLSSARRMALHAAALAVLGPDIAPEVRAAHLEGADRLPEALTAWRAAMERAKRRGAWGEVLRIAERLEACGPDANGRLEAHADAVGALRMRGRYAEAVDRADRALAAIDGAEARTVRRCRSERGRALMRAVRHAEGLDELRAVVASCEAPADRAVALEALGEALSEASQLEASIEVRRESLALRRAAGDPVWAAQAQVSLANVLQRQDRVVEARAMLEDAIGKLRAPGQQMWLANALATHALVAALRLDEATCERSATEAAALFRSLGMLVSEAQVLGVLADGFRRQGRRADCTATIDDMEALAHAVASPRLHAAVAFNRAMAHHTLGGPDPLGALLSCVEICRETRHSQGEAVAATQAAVRLRREGRWREAIALIDRVAVLGEARGDLGLVLDAAIERAHHALLDGRDGRSELARVELSLAAIPDAHAGVLDEIGALRRRVLGTGDASSARGR